MFEMVLKTVANPERQKKDNAFSEFQKKFSKFEKATTQISSKEKKELLYGRNYRAN